MRRMAALQLEEVLQEAGADFGRAFRVELDAVEVAPLHAGAERIAVIAAGNRRRTRRERVAVHEINVVTLTHSLEQGAWAFEFQGVPSHVRNGPRGRGGEAAGLPRNDAETTGVAFVGGFEQQLHPQANAEHRLLERGNQSV